MNQWYKPGGCKERMMVCQKKAREEDPDWRGNLPSVMKCFEDLYDMCVSIADAESGINVGLI
jgi:hypothetical protein